MGFPSLRSLAFAAFVPFVVLPSAEVVQALSPEDAPLSRGEAVALLVESDPLMRQNRDLIAHDLPPIAIYYDVGQDSFLAPSIEAAFEAGVLQGNMFNRTFRPFDPLLGGEAVVFLARVLARGDALALAALSANAPGEAYYMASLRSLAMRGMMLPDEWTPAVPVDSELLRAIFANAGISLVQSSPIPAVDDAPVARATTSVPTQPRPAFPRAEGVPAHPSVTIGTVIHAPQPQVAMAAEPNASQFGITLPSLGITNLTVIHPADPFTDKGLLEPLKDGVGHLFSYPGNGGKILIYGHSSGYPWDVSQYTKIFRQINRLQIGDTVTVQYGGRTYNYQVTVKETVSASDLSAYQDGGDGEELILYTCWPPDSIAERYLVRARPV